MTLAHSQPRSLLPFLPRLTIDWARRDGAPSWQLVDGSLLFVDISGFTKMSERLARHGRLGAEEVTDAVEACFGALLALAYAAGGSLLKFGGDALLILFTGPEHETRAATSAIAMQERLGHVGEIDTSAGRVKLRMSAGVHSGTFGCFLVGESHRELVLAGIDVSTVVEMEGTASAGQIVVSTATAAAIDPHLVGPRLGPGYRLRRVAVRIPEDPAPRSLDAEYLDLSPYLPAAIRSHVLAGGGDPEHRSVCIAFCHFDGTDALMRDHGPEAVATALHGLVDAVQREVDRAGITFLATDVDHDGGKIILASGVPASTGQDVDALLAAVRRIGDTELPLPLRIGVHRGPVFAGEVGPTYRRTFTVMGDTVNLTARLMAKAAPGEIVASPDILSPARTQFDTTQLEPFMVKGKRKPVAASTLGATQRRESRTALVLPLVGRATELTAIAESLDAVRAGAGRAIEFVGPAGMGKSRLTDELRAMASDLPQLTVACDPYEAASPYAAFWWLMHDVLAQPPTAARSDVAEALAASVAWNCPALEPWLPLLGVPLDLELPPTPEVSAIATEFIPEKVREVTAAFLNAALPQPVVVIIEDAHWIDDASSLVLDQIIRTIPQRRTLICLTRRDDTTGHRLIDRPHTQSLTLRPLTAEDAASAVIQATDASPLRAADVALLSERAAGNPLFLEELLETLRDGGDIGTLPTSVDALVTAQIDRLHPELRTLVRVASVLGQSFLLDELSALIADELPPPGHDVWNELASILAFTGPGALRFRHALVRDAAYQELPFRRRRELHARAGDAIAAQLGDHPDTEAELLSLHYFHAQRYDDAWRFARIAADRAVAKYANVEAAELLQRAINAARRGADVFAADLASLWVQLGDVSERSGIYDQALRAYRNARRLTAADHVAVAGILLKEAWIAERTGRYSEAVRAVRRGFKILSEDDSVAAARARVRLRAWYATVRQAQGRSREAVQECLAAIADAADDPETEAQARFTLDWAYVSIGQPKLAVHSDRALELYTQLGDLSGQATVLNNLGGFAYFDGRWDEAVELYERARELRQRTGNSVDAALGTLNIGEVLIDQGRLEEAAESLAESNRVFRAADYRGASAIADLYLARVATQRGELESAFVLLERAKTELLAIGADSDALSADLQTAECLLIAGETDAALQLAGEILRRDRALGGVIDHAPLLRIRARALLAQADLEGARQAITGSLQEARERDASFEIARSLEVLAAVEDRLDNSRAAAEHRAEATERFDRLGVLSRT
jgi:Predicted ATPase